MKDKFMNWLVWLIFGGLAGWLATVITGTDAGFGIVGNIIIGIIGAWIGGWLARAVFKAPGVTGFDIRSFIVAILGSVVLLWVVSLF